MASPRNGTMPSLVAPASPLKPEPADSADPGEVERLKARQRKSRTGKYGLASFPPDSTFPPNHADSPNGANHTRGDR